MAIRALGRKSRILIVVSVVFALAISISAYNVTTNLKNYRALLQNEAPSSQAENYKESVRDNLQLALNISSFPGIAQLLNLVNLNFSSIEDELLTAVEIAPAILASPKPLKYLVAIQNSAEARGTGGILGAYAIVEFYKGTLVKELSSDATALAGRPAPPRGRTTKTNMIAPTFCPLA